MRILIAMESLTKSGGFLLIIKSKNSAKMQSDLKSAEKNLGNLLTYYQKDNIINTTSRYY